jgi:hypothetical protein
MQEDDTWPLPHYNPGSRGHLHALGVISITFANFQASIDSHYWQCAAFVGQSLDQAESEFFKLSEEGRIKATKVLIRRLDTDVELIKSVDNVLDFYNWCRKCRNIIVHSERYPPAFGGKEDELHMIKWTRPSLRKPSEPQYVKFTVSQLRGIADNFRVGVKQSAELHMHIRYRGAPIEKVPDLYKPYASKPPRPLKIPHALKTSNRPQS